MGVGWLECIVKAARGGRLPAKYSCVMDTAEDVFYMDLWAGSCLTEQIGLGRAYVSVSTDNIVWECRVFACLCAITPRSSARGLN